MIYIYIRKYIIYHLLRELLTSSSIAGWRIVRIIPSPKLKHFRSIFRGYVTFREGNFLYFPGGKRTMDFHGAQLPRRPASVAAPASNDPPVEGRVITHRRFGSSQIFQSLLHKLLLDIVRLPLYIFEPTGWSSNKPRTTFQNHFAIWRFSTSMSMNKGFPL